MESILNLLIILLYCLQAIQGEIRCYCTEASCVSNGYMCKSEAGRCYSSVKIEGESTHSVHGCIETLTSDIDRKFCRTYNDKIRPMDSGAELPMLLCCGDDMCNYREKFDINIVFANGSVNKGTKGHESLPSVKRKPDTENVRLEEKDLWFKAAVIAVPIAGGFILILLVLLAVKMLKSDSKRQRRLIHVRNERSVAKAKLYVKDHFVSRNCEHSYCSPIFCDRQFSHKGPSRTIERDGNVYQSISDNCSNSSPPNQNTCLKGPNSSHINQKCCTRTTPPSSVIVSIGQNSKCEPAALV